MSTILVRIFLHGLIALVPVQDNGSSNHMIALLVDARDTSRSAAVASKCVVPHLPKLVVRTTGMDCFDAGCTKVDDLCRCAPEHQDIRIEPDSAPTSTVLKRAPDTEMPVDASKASEYSYVANLTNLNLALDPNFLTGSPPALLARMKFAFDSLTACSLSTREHDDGSMYVHPLSFGRLGDGPSGAAPQAMAQLLMAKVNLPFNNATPIVLRLSSFDASSSKTLTLLPESCDLHSNEQCIDIHLSNERPDLFKGDPCDDGIARDFAFFYDLMQDPPAWEARRIPRVNPAGAKLASDLEVPECTHHDKNPESRPICPMASFN